MIKLDKLDKHIIYFLDHSGRASFSEMARTFKRGRDIIEYRVKRLEERNIITGYKAVLDPYKFGLTLFKSYIRLSATKQRKKVLLTQLKNEKHVFWIAECSGAYDLIVSIAASSPLEFHQLQARLFTPVNDLLISWDVYQVVNFRLFRLKYLNVPGTHWWEIGDYQTCHDLDNQDYTLLELLSKDGRMSITDFSNILGIAPDTVKNRMKKLEQEKYILGYQATINLSALQITQFKAQLFLSNFDIEEEEQLRAYCNKHPNIVAYILQIGSYRTEIEVHVSDYEEYNSIIEELREKFIHLIKHINTILMSDEFFNWGVIKY